MNVKMTDTVGQIVATNINAASVFNNYGVDFYSRSNRTLEHVSLDDNVPIMELLEDLYDLDGMRIRRPDFTTMSADDLASYILRTHHKFTEQRLVYLRNTIGRISGFYDEGESTLSLIKKEFQTLSVYLTVHMQHEEFIVFPFIQKMTKTKQLQKLGFQEIERPINSMRDDHEHEVSVLRKLEKLTNRYEPPVQADYALKTVYATMRELAEDLKIHMHLENNILFPKAIDFAAAHIRNFN